MIERGEAGTFDVECDGCGDVETFFVDGDWSELMSEMDRSGWIKTKVYDKWEHYCPICSCENICEEDFPDDDEDDEDEVGDRDRGPECVWDAQEPPPVEGDLRPGAP
jgi:hypothetical protein